MPNAKVLIRQTFKPLTKEKKLEVWNKVKARIATGEYCEITAKEYAGLTDPYEKRRRMTLATFFGGIGRKRYVTKFGQTQMPLGIYKLIPNVLIHKRNC